MGIRFLCPNGHRLNVKTFLAGKRAICPNCGARVVVPYPSEQPALEATQSPTATITPPSAFTAPTDYEPVDVTSTSVVIAVEPHPPAPPAPTTASTTSTLGRGAAAIDGIPESIVATTAPPATPDVSIGAQPDAVQVIRRKTQRRQLLIAITLLLTVIVLAVVLVWVLRRSAAPAPVVAPATSQSVHRKRDRVDSRFAGYQVTENHNRMIGS